MQFIHSLTVERRATTPHDSYKAQLSRYMEHLEHTLHASIAEDQQPVVNLVRTLLLRGGKRLRPTLVWACARAHRAEPDGLLPIGAATELVHLASLVHDDMLDDSDTRRGAPALHTVHGTKVAILTGDYLFAKAFSLLAPYHHIQAVNIMTEAIAAMCAAEIDQMTGCYDPEFDIPRYLQLIDGKTAQLVSAASELGGRLGGRPPEEVAHLARYGLHLGRAFQLTDDLLDFYGDPVTLGKPVGSDFSRGVLTLPVLLLLEHPKHRPWLVEVIAKRETGAAFGRVSDALHHTGILAEALAWARRECDAALQELEHISDQGEVSHLAELAKLAVSRRR